MSVTLSPPFAAAHTDHHASHDDIACFSVHGQADPGLIGRVVDVFAKRGWTPLSMHVVTIPAQSSLDADEMVIDLQCRYLPSAQPELDMGMERLTGSIASRLRTVPLVQAVYASQRLRAD